MVKAQDFHLRVLFYHLYDTVVHLRLQLVVAEIEGIEALQATDSVDDFSSLALDHLQLLHL